MMRNTPAGLLLLLIVSCSSANHEGYSQNRREKKSENSVKKNAPADEVESPDPKDSDQEKIIEDPGVPHQNPDVPLAPELPPAEKKPPPELPAPVTRTQILGNKLPLFATVTGSNKLIVTSFEKDHSNNKKFQHHTRFLPEGLTQDASFGSAGVATLIAPSNTVKASIRNVFEGVSSGKIYAFDDPVKNLSTLEGALISRTTSSGHADPSFGNKGFFRYRDQNSNFHMFPTALTEGADGSIYFAYENHTITGSFNNIPFYRENFTGVGKLLPDGRFDSNFAGNVFTDYPELNIFLSPIPGGSHHQWGTRPLIWRYMNYKTAAFTDYPGRTSGGAAIHQIAIDGKGRILAVGFGQFNRVVTRSDEVYADTHVRLNPDGSLDRSFAVNGVRQVRPIEGVVIPKILHIFPDDSYLVFGPIGVDWIAWHSTHPGNEFQNVEWNFVKYDSKGSIDTTYGNGGRAVIKAPYTVIGNNKFYIDYIDRAKLANDFIYVLGRRWYLSATGDPTAGSEDNEHETFIRRYKLDGSLDTTFSTDGVLWKKWLSEDLGLGRKFLSYTDFAVNKSGKIFIVGCQIKTFFGDCITLDNEENFIHQLEL